MLFGSDLILFPFFFSSYPLCSNLFFYSVWTGVQVAPGDQIIISLTNGGTAVVPYETIGRKLEDGFAFEVPVQNTALSSSVRLQLHREEDVNVSVLEDKKDYNTELKVLLSPSNGAAGEGKSLISLFLSIIVLVALASQYKVRQK
jgi:hypothetical protein